MNPLFVRFGLPWLIFGSALYALYWNVLNGERAYSTTPIARVEPSTVHSRVANTSIVAARNESRPMRQKIVVSAAINSQPMEPERQSTVSNVPTPAAIQPPLAAPDVMSSLQDPDPSVRLQALAESEAQGIVVPVHTLQQMATTDRDAAVRIQAMTKYAQDPSVHPALVMAAAEAGLRDGDAMVRAHAQEILEQMNQATRSNDELPAWVPNDAPVE